MTARGETPPSGAAQPLPLDAGWLLDLRARFVSVARRRVQASDVEDIVQDAMRIVIEKHTSGPGSGWVEGLPPVAWCFNVLRNTIGNHYQRTRVRSRILTPLETAGDPASLGATPLEALESEDAVARIHDALASLAAENESCARFLSQLLRGVSPADLASAERLEEAILYRRVYRCRQRLRVLLAEKGVLA